MGRLPYLLVLLAACSYTTPPSSIGDDDQPLPDSTAPDSPADSMIAPDTMPPDSMPPQPTTTDHVASADAWIDENNQFFNHGGDLTLVTDGGPTGLGVTLMRFDLSGLATTTQVTAAELHVFTTTDEGDTVTVFPMLVSWSEGTATWTQRAMNTAWPAAGAAPPSRGTTMIATFDPILEETEFSPVIDTATVQGWVTDPDTNFGIAITSVQMDGVVLHSRNGAVSKPFLRISHLP